ncbi:MULTISPECIES: hypothetical protein [unclassified Mycobacterium]|uniref:hypothetical protein n=1 Tax=unclassified Mycobacterium TaxID=2642494 RepID=UPI0012E1F495|nr:MULTISPECIES: hypothetical protein [unclassified Mycobacterium]
MSDAAEPVGETLRDEDLKSEKQISRRSIRTAAAAATGAAIAAGAASMLGGATAPSMQADEQPGRTVASTVIVANGVDLTDGDLTSPSEVGPVIPTDMTDMKGNACPVGGDEWKGVNADGQCTKKDKYPWQ